MTMLNTDTAAKDAAVKDTTTSTFVKDVIEESRRQPVLVDFWAEWCGPCKQLGPVLEKVVRAAKGKVKLVKMDIDKHPSIPGQLGIQSIPAVFAFVNGQPVDGFLGALPESQITAFIERVTKDRVGGEEKDLLKSADDALASDPREGRQMRVLFKPRHHPRLPLHIRTGLQRFGLLHQERGKHPHPHGHRHDCIAHVPA